MTDRNDLDRPAAVTAFALGAVLILISISLFVVTGGAGPKEAYSVSWSQSSGPAATPETVGAAGATTTVDLPIDDLLVSNITITLTTTDAQGTPATNPAATCTWTLKDGNETVDSGTECRDTFDVAIGGHPDVAEIKGGSQAGAQAALWNEHGDGNRTTTYRLEFSWRRAEGTLPPPLAPASSFTGTVTLSAKLWSATVNERSQEAAR